MTETKVKRLTVSLSYMVAFISLDVMIFSSLYIIHTLASTNFGFFDAMVSAGYELLWRVFSFQLFLQYAAMLVVFYVGIQKNILVMLAVALFAFAISSVWSISEVSSVWKLMLITTDAMGEGFAIFISVIFAFLILRALRVS